MDRLGYKCELAPDFTFAVEGEAYFGIRVIDYPSVRPRVKPDRTFFVCVFAEELFEGSFGTESAVWKESHKRLFFRLTSGASKLSYAMQSLIGGFLASSTEGYLYDPQDEELIAWFDAVEHEIRAIKLHGDPHDVREEEFIGWPQKA